MRDKVGPQVAAVPADDAIDQVRFADAEDGWLWGTFWEHGPDMWSTHDGGTHWSEQQFPSVQAGAEVLSDVGASAGAVQAAFGANPFSPIQPGAARRLGSLANDAAARRRSRSSGAVRTARHGWVGARSGPHPRWWC